MTEIKLNPVAYAALLAEYKRCIILPEKEASFNQGDPFKVVNTDQDNKESMVVLVTYIDDATPLTNSKVYSIKILIKSGKI